MDKVLLFVSLLLMSTVLFAEQHTDENKLLKSWGFQFNAQGKLIFNAGSQQGLEYKPWSPNFSTYLELESVTGSSRVLDPLVISSKHRTGP